MVRSIMNYIKRQRDFRETHRELSKLSNRELEDIGLSRGMITRVALEHAYENTN